MIQYTENVTGWQVGNNLIAPLQVWGSPETEWGGVGLAGLGKATLLRSEDGTVLAVLGQGQELLPRFRILPEHSQHGAGHRAAVHLLDSTHDHAHVTAAKHNMNSVFIYIITY